MLTTESHAWAITSRRSSELGEAARREAQTWLRENASWNVSAQATLNGLPAASGGLCLLRKGEAILGAAVTTGPTAYLEVCAGDARDELLEQLLDAVSADFARPKRVMCLATLAAGVEAWFTKHGGPVTSEEFLCLQCTKASGVQAPAGARLAGMGDLRALEAYAEAYAAAGGGEMGSDWPGLVAAGNVALIEDGDGQPVSFAALLAKSAGLVRIGGNWSSETHRRRGYATAVANFLIERALSKDCAVQVHIPKGTGDPSADQAQAFYASLGFEALAGFHCLSRTD